jgi:putative acetyltransferase
MDAPLLIAPARPDAPEIARLIAELDAHAASLYPAESNHLLPIEALLAPEVRFFAATLGGSIVGCGAVVCVEDASGLRYGEVKRMYTDPAARGRGIGWKLLARIEEVARASGLACLRLETGPRNVEALGLYRKAGFAERGPFGDYGPDPLSVFMEKPL